MSARYLLIDMETQRDFFLPGGSLYERSANTAAGNVYRLFDWAKTTGVPVLSSVLLVRPGEHSPLSPRPHCIEGSGGERKLPRTLLRSRINLGLGYNTDLPHDLFQRHQQVIFEKRTTDIFSHVRAERLLTDLPKDTTVVVCGAGVAHGIKQAVVGLRTRGFPVVVAEDAVLHLNDPLAEMAWLQMMAKSTQPLPTAQIVRDLVPRRRARAAMHSPGTAKS